MSMHTSGACEPRTCETCIAQADARERRDHVAAGKEWWGSQPCQAQHAAAVSRGVARIEEREEREGEIGFIRRQAAAATQAAYDAGLAAGRASR